MSETRSASVGCSTAVVERRASAWGSVSAIAGKVGMTFPAARLAPDETRLAGGDRSTAEGDHRPADEPFLPAPALARGGGAIHGMGERFSVAPAKGTASLNVPLALTPGRGPTTPGLSLSYDSGAGNS